MGTLEALEPGWWEFFVTFYEEICGQEAGSEVDDCDFGIFILWTTGGVLLCHVNSMSPLTLPKDEQPFYSQNTVHSNTSKSEIENILH